MNLILNCCGKVTKSLQRVKREFKACCRDATVPRLVEAK